MRRLLILAGMVLWAAFSSAQELGPHDVSIAKFLGTHDPRRAKKIGQIDVDFSSSETCQIWTSNTSYTNITEIGRYNAAEYNGVIIDGSSGPTVCEVTFALGNPQSGLDGRDYYIEVIPLDGSYNFVTDWSTNIIARSDKVDGSESWNYGDVQFIFSVQAAAIYSGSTYFAVAIKSISSGLSADTLGSYDAAIYCSARFYNDQGTSTSNTVGMGAWAASNGNLTTSDADDNLVFSIFTMQE